MIKFIGTLLVLIAFVSMVYLSYIIIANTINVGFITNVDLFILTLILVIFGGLLLKEGGDTVGEDNKE